MRALTVINGTIGVRDKEYSGFTYCPLNIGDLVTFDHNSDIWRIDDIYTTTPRFCSPTFTSQLLTDLADCTQMVKEEACCRISLINESEDAKRVYNFYHNQIDIYEAFFDRLSFPSPRMQSTNNTPTTSPMTNADTAPGKDEYEYKLVLSDDQKILMLYGGEEIKYKVRVGEVFKNNHGKLWDLKHIELKYDRDGYSLKFTSDDMTTVFYSINFNDYVRDFKFLFDAMHPTGDMDMVEKMKQDYPDLSSLLLAEKKLREQAKTIPKIEDMVKDFRTRALIEDMDRDRERVSLAGFRKTITSAKTVEDFHVLFAVLNSCLCAAYKNSILYGKDDKFSNQFSTLLRSLLELNEYLNTKTENIMKSNVENIDNKKEFNHWNPYEGYE